MIIISDRLRRPAEVERDELRKQLAEAKAEIERLKSEHEDSLRRAKNNAVSLSGAVTEYAGELLVKSKLIEQMREALKLVDSVAFALPKWFDGDDISVWNTVKAALAAERGG